MWAESRLLSRLFHFKCFTPLRKYLALHKQKTDISCESDNKLDEGIFLSDGLTEMWSKVNILMT